MDLPSIYWTHYAHMNDFRVRVGDHVQAGQLLGHVGKAGTTSAHLHFEVHKVDPRKRGFNKYTTGMNQDQVLQVYSDPVPFMAQADHFVMVYTGFGYKFLDVNANNQIHPGSDLNRGSGNADLGDAIYAPKDGVVIYGQYNEGWGNHLFLEHESLTKAEMEKLKQLEHVINEHETRIKALEGNTEKSTLKRLIRKVYHNQEAKKQ